MSASGVMARDFGATLLRWARRPWVWVVIVVLLVASTFLALRFAPVFRVEHIDVLGNSQVSADEVLSAAQVSDSTPLLDLPVDEIESRIESLDAVAGARVVRDWPDSVKIVVRERRPVGYVQTVNGVGLVGSDGSIYRELEEAPNDLPELPALAAGPAGVGDSYQAGADETDSAVFDVAGSLPRSLQRPVDTITADSARTVLLTFGDGVVVEWGSPGSGDEKSTVVEALRKRPGWGTSFTVVDVTAPEAPAFR
ncbi:MAG: FtsQ-type POTRA domain-containing protein [Actinomycetia bacterium]|nr:FtsQ-type POTRA domain-containing protein [Actinomycetes bacterium]